MPPPGNWSTSTVNSMITRAAKHFPDKDGDAWQQAVMAQRYLKWVVDADCCQPFWRYWNRKGGVRSFYSERDAGAPNVFVARYVPKPSPRPQPPSSNSKGEPIIIESDSNDDGPAPTHSRPPRNPSNATPAPARASNSSPPKQSSTPSNARQPQSSTPSNARQPQPYASGPSTLANFRRPQPYASGNASGNISMSSRPAPNQRLPTDPSTPSHTSAKVMTPGKRSTRVENPTTAVNTTVGTAKRSGNVIRASLDVQGRLNYRIIAEDIVGRRIEGSRSSSIAFDEILFDARFYGLSQNETRERVVAELMRLRLG